MDFIFGLVEKSGILGAIGALVAIVGIICIAGGGGAVGAPLLLVGGGVWVWRRFFS